MNKFDQNWHNNKNFWSQLKLRTQMLLGYAIPIFVFGSSTSIVYINANQVFVAFTQVEKVQYAIIEVDRMSLSGSNMVANVRGYILVGTSDFFQLYQQNWQTFQKASNNLEPVVVIEEQKKRFQQMKEIGREYNEYANKIYDLIRNNKQKEALKLFQTGGRGKKFLLDFLKLNYEFSDVERKRLEEENKQARNTLQNAVNLLIIGTIISAITGLIIAWLISSLVSRKISQAIHAIYNSSAEINTTVSQQQKITSSQAISVNQTTKTMGELEFSANQASKQAEVSTIGAKQVLSLAKSGNELVEKTLVEMGEMKDKVEGIAQKILRLSEQINQIGSISQEVSNLANQTNMLALNAAVEAVRAGESGKGFSIVAAEIRKLADESQKSAHKINTLVADIKQATNVTVIVTEAGIKSVENTVYLAQQTASAFGNMSGEINSIFTNSQQIHLSAKEQAMAIQEVVSAMNNLNQNAQDSSNGMGQIKIGIQKLNDAAFGLKDIVQDA